jgi:hypothetical protein
VLIGASVRNEPSLKSRNLFRRTPGMPSRLSEYRPGQLRVKAKPRRTRRSAALTQSFNPGRISHYPGMGMEKQKTKARPSRFHCHGPHHQIQKARCEGRTHTPKGRISTIRTLESVVDIRLSSSLIARFLQPQAALSDGRGPPGGRVFCSRHHWVSQ